MNDKYQHIINSSRLAAVLLLSAGLLIGAKLYASQAFVAAEPDTGTGRAQSTRTNVLFILVDQQRQDGIGAYGLQTVKTPHLDKLAKAGAIFTRAYTAQPLCSPNRASLFSGLYPFNHGVRENTWELAKEIKLLPQYLKEYGYKSAYFGKWHLGDKARQAFDTFPNYPNDGRGTAHYYERDGKRVYQTEVLSNDAIAFIREHKAHPFLAVVSMYPPHPPYSVPEKYEALFEDIFPEDEARRKYYAMGTAIDDTVGKMLKALQELGLDENTLVLYTTEHGHFFEQRWNQHNKRAAYDEAARIPLLMKYPEKIPAGQINDLLFNSVDLTPTLLGLLGIPVTKQLDGHDWSNTIAGLSGFKPGYTAFINVPYIDKQSKPYRPMLEKGEERIIVYKDWKLILSTVRPPELYHLASDPEEKTNIWQLMRATPLMAELKTHFAKWANRTNDELTPELLQTL